MGKRNKTDPYYETSIEFARADALEAAHQLFYREDIINRIKNAETKTEIYRALRDGRDKL